MMLYSIFHILGNIWYFDSKFYEFRGNKGSGRNLQEEDDYQASKPAYRNQDLCIGTQEIMQCGEKWGILNFKMSEIKPNESESESRFKIHVKMSVLMPHINDMRCISVS
jgi:hypothetical protein